MKPMPLCFSSFVYLLLASFVVAQQFSGDVINNTLPAVPGSEITFFRITDPAGKSNGLTLTNYFSLANNQRLDTTKVRRIVIIIHGLNRDPGTYMSNMLSALAQTTSDRNVSFSSVQIMAPYFPNGDDKNVGYPWTNGLKPGRGSTSNALVWPGSQWSAGGNNQYPWNATAVSSYEVLDQLIQYFDNRTRYPNVNQIVLAGHSLGAQTVGRYAQIGKPMNTSSPVSYWIGNPNSWAWLSTSRPLDTSTCPTYDDWREGYTNFTQYPMTYGVGLVAKGRSAILANYNAKSKIYARGTLDTGDDSTGCAPFTTGINRNERFFNFIKAFPPICTSPTGQCDAVDYVPVDHDGGAMMASAAGQARLFLDNFYGDGKRAYDFGYPRKQAGDDPYPNPAANITTMAGNITFAGGMFYQGCWTDNNRGFRTLPYQPYPNDVNNTIEKCTSACATAGYTIAACEFGVQCFCGSILGPYSSQTVDAGCDMPCSGNSSQSCGDSNRLSLYSATVPSQAAQPGTPETVGNYTSAYCYTEATSGRALSAKSYSDGSNMTLESCAAFCNGYPLFGVEFGSECYCGSYFNSGSVIASGLDCSMTCSGNALEYCGAANRLTVYVLQAGAPVSTITQSAPASLSTPLSTTTTTPVPSASLCPTVDSQNVQTTAGDTYAVKCKSDSTVGAYAGVSATSSYLDCMTICDSQGATTCQSFVYVGGSGGLGPGTCWLKSDIGTATRAGGSFVFGFRSSSSPSTTPPANLTTSSASDLASSASLVTTSTTITSSSTMSALSISMAAPPFTNSSSISTTASPSASLPISSSLSKSTLTNLATDNTTTTTAPITGDGTLTPNASTTTQSSGFKATCTTLFSTLSLQTALTTPLKTSIMSNAATSTYTTASIAPTLSNVTSSILQSLSSASLGLTFARSSSMSPNATTASGISTPQATTNSNASVRTTSSLTLLSTKSFNITSALPTSLSLSSQARRTMNASSIFRNATTATLISTTDSPRSSSVNVSWRTLLMTNSTTKSFDINSTMPNSLSSTSLGSSTTNASMTSARVTTNLSESAKQSTSISNGTTQIASSSSDRLTESTTVSTTTLPEPSVAASSSTPFQLSTSISNTTMTTPSSGISGATTSLLLAYWTTTSATESISATSPSMNMTSSSTSMSSASVVAGSDESNLSTSGPNAMVTSSLIVSSPAASTDFINATGSSTTLSVGGNSTAHTTTMQGSSILSSNTLSPSTISSVVATTSRGSNGANRTLTTTLVTIGGPHISTASMTDVTSTKLVANTTFVSMAVPSMKASTSGTSAMSMLTTTGEGLPTTGIVISNRTVVIQHSTSTPVPTTTTAHSSTNFTASTTIRFTASPSSTTAPIVLPSSFSALGCFADSPNRRALPSAVYSNTSNTPTQCALFCRSEGYRYAGTEYGAECWCGNYLPAGNSTSSGCTTQCPGDKSQTCGGGNRLNLYVDEAWKQSFFVPDAYASWRMDACYIDLVSKRTLPLGLNPVSGGGRNMTVGHCLDTCSAKGLPFCGVEYFGECWGGKSAPNASLALMGDPLRLGCDFPCRGNASEACGGANRLMVYVNGGSTMT